MNTKYVLDSNGEPVLESSLDRWAQWYEARTWKTVRVGRNKIGGVTVSTVFLGLDHSFVKGPPILWETMTFGEPMDQVIQSRCSGSREQAQAMHSRVCKQVTEYLQAEGFIKQTKTKKKGKKK